MSSLQIVQLVCLLTVLQGQLSLQRPDTTFGLSRQKEYYFSSSFKLNWFKAVEYCRSRGMFLLSVRNAEEREAVIEYLAGTGYTRTHDWLVVWTSGNDLGEEGDFHWASTGERVTYANWRDTEPNNVKTDDYPSEDCMVLDYTVHRGPDLNYKFNDMACRKQFVFVCETLPQ